MLFVSATLFYYLVILINIWCFVGWLVLLHLFFLLSTNIWSVLYFFFLVSVTSTGMLDLSKINSEVHNKVPKMSSFYDRCFVSRLRRAACLLYRSEPFTIAYGKLEVHN